MSQRVKIRHSSREAILAAHSSRPRREAWFIRDPALVPEATQQSSGHLQVSPRQASRPSYQLVGDLAVISIHGMMLKSYDLWLTYLGEAQAIMPEIALAVDAAAADPAVQTILLHVDSPGGTAAGTDELAETIYRARQKKTVIAWIDDLGASAAYYAASQATRVVTGPSGVVGSIGTYLIVRDYSQALTDAGIKTFVVKAGEHKGDGTPGTEITDEHLAEWQREVDALTANFVSAVARGRGRSVGEVSAWADGRVHVGQAARDMGLVDDVMPFADLLDELRGSPGTSTVGVTARKHDAAGRVAQAPGAADVQANTPIPTTGGTIMNEKLRKYLESKGLSTAASAAEAIAFWQTLEGADMAEANRLALDVAPATPPAPPATQTVAPAAPPVDAAAVAAQAAEAERRRSATVMALCRQLDLTSEEAEQIVRGTKTLAEAQTAALAKHADKVKPVANVRVGEDRNMTSLAAAIGDAVLAQRGVSPLETNPVTRLPDPAKPRALHPRHTQFRGHRAVGMARQFLEAIGRSTTGMEDAEVAQAVFHTGPVVPLNAASGFHTTADFPYLLAAAYNTQMLARYVELQPQWPQFCGRTTAPDLKQNSLVRRGEVPNLPIVMEGEDYHLATLGESKEVYTVVKRGQIIALTWEMLLNDTLGAFADLLVDQGQAARRAEDVVAFAQLTSNPTMGDGEALFSTAHANLAVTEIGAPTIAAFDEMELRLGLQTGLSSDAYLNLQPAWVATPRALAGTTRTLLKSQFDPADTNGKAANTWQDRVRHITHPLLDAHNPAAWYGGTDPSVMAAIVLCFLRGYEAPQLSQENGFDNDTRKFKVTHFVAAKAAEWRALFKNEGASA